MNIDEKQLAGKPRQVGTLDGVPVMEFATKGGLNLITTMRSNKPEILGAGSHRAIARNVAKKTVKKNYRNAIQWSSLEKSEWIDEVYYKHLLPKYEAITDQLRNASK